MPSTSKHLATPKPQDLWVSGYRLALECGWEPADGLGHFSLVEFISITTLKGKYKPREHPQTTHPDNSQFWWRDNLEAKKQLTLPF